MGIDKKIWNGDLVDLFDNNGIYSNDFFLDKRGKFKRCYWDKVNGSWGKKKDVFKSKKFYWYEFENIINEKGIVDLFKDFNESEYLGFKYIDRVGYFISEIFNELMLKKSSRDGIEFNIKNKRNGVYISYKDLEGILGKDFRKIVDRLCYIDLLIVMDGGSNENNRNFRLFKYDLNIELLGNLCGKKFIENIVLEKFLINRSDEKLVYVNENELKYIKELSLNISDEKLEEICNIKWENKKDEIRRELSWGKMFNKKELSIKKELLLKSDGEEYKDLIRKRYFLFKDKLIDVRNGIIDGRVFFRDEKIYRSYNLINGMDKEFRKELRYKGKELVELDIKSCFISCLVYLLERLNLFNRIDYKSELKKERKNISLYDKIRELEKYRFSIKKEMDNYDGFDELFENNVGESRDLNRILSEVDDMILVERSKLKNKEKKNVREFGVKYDYRFDEVLGGNMLYNNFDYLFEFRYEIFKDRYGLDDISDDLVKELYDWGNVEGDYLSDVFKRINNISNTQKIEDLYGELYSELEVIGNNMRIVNGDFDDSNFSGINNNYRNFIRSDNRINEVKNLNVYKEYLINNDVEKSGIIDGELIRGKDWDVKFSYDDYKSVRGDLFNMKLKDNVSSNEKISKWFKESWIKKEVGDEFFKEDWGKVGKYYNYEVDKIKNLNSRIKLENIGEDLFEDFKRIINKRLSEYIKIVSFSGLVNDWKEDEMLLYMLYKNESESVEFIYGFVDYVNENEELEYDLVKMLDIESDYWKNKKFWRNYYYNIKCYGFDEFKVRYLDGCREKNKRKVEYKYKVDDYYDSSKVGLVDGLDFIEKFRDLFNSGKVDFYSYLRFNYSRKIYSYEKLEKLNVENNDYGKYLYDEYMKGKIDIDGYLKEMNIKFGEKVSIGDYIKNENDWGEWKLFDRNFYKILVLRLMFSKIKLSENLGNNLYNNLSEKIFGKDVSLLMKRLKSSDLKFDVFGNKLNKVDKRENYKNLFKVLGMIEVDVIDYLENNFLIDEGFYVKIFDGIMVEKEGYWMKRLKMNYFIKKNVGYMFEMR